MSETWTIPPYPLRWPLKDDQGRTVDTLTFRPILHGEHAEVLAKHTDDDDRLIALLELATGQTPALLETLRKPDYNSLAARIAELVNQDAAHFMSETIDPDNPRLLVPIDTGGQRLERLTIEVPSLKASREMQKIGDPQKRSEFITAHCTGLMLPDLAELSVPDWNQLQGRLDDFLNEPASSFPLAT